MKMLKKLLTGVLAAAFVLSLISAPALASGTAEQGEETEEAGDSSENAPGLEVQDVKGFLYPAAPPRIA